MSVDKGLTRHGHVSYLEIPAVNVEQSAAFYEAVLNWEIHQRQPGNISFDDRSGDLIGRWVTGRKASREPGLVPYTYVDRIDDVVQRIVKHGGEIVKAPYPEGDLWVATFRDPTGNLMGIWQEGPR
jgi:predicted enzyme related to lactoylglutathione lyase